MIETTLDDLSPAVAAGFHAVRCRRLLRDRADVTDSEVTTKTVAWGDGDYHSQAFSTVYRRPFDPDTLGPFAREVVAYQSNHQPDDDTRRYRHYVQYHPDGHHEQHYRYELGVIER